ncbi:xanthine dehydrogenase small subunit [Polaromonas sp.]|uniref:xanthine dehydrogenase small subunit n=1 Tax=Polaromonas sp. TaxID=1869339 RepID=UPI002489819C|nr:xanthine dehydrogenase small subunit [Polaromonas sp.]MDI1273344.1 xanthine dehydrogenase small subunit [Polaromonas sp.]
MDIQSPLKTIQFIRGGEVVALANVPPSRTLLEVLREDLGCTGTKEGCGEGDCGACTVVLGEAEGGKIRYKAVNSCIKLAHSIDGQALWTVEDLTTDPLIKPSRAGGGLGARRAETGMDTKVHEDFEHRATTPPVRAAGLHPAQEAMVNCHGSQCGFCTPGFVMSLFGMYQNHVACGKPITRELAQQELSGNLCRCTGYRPIFDAAQQMASLPAVQVDEAELLSKLKLLAPAPKGLEANLVYNSPRTLADLLAARAAHPGAQLVAGCTDVGLWVTKMHKAFSQVLDVTRVEELRRIERYPHHIAIGAAVTLSEAFAALVADRPQLQTFANRFAGLPVRNAGTLGGNVANGSPIGDSMPLLIALGANVVLMSTRGHREMPLEALYTGYRQNVMAPDEVLAWIKVPLPDANDVLKAYKISKRYDDDISAVCLVINLQLEGGKVSSISIGAGGVAATPARAVQTEAFLRGKAWTQATVRGAMGVLRGEFTPLSDMRASASYRSEVLGNLLQRFWLESQGLQQINLESFRLEEAQA